MGRSAAVTFTVQPSHDRFLGQDEEGHWIIRDARGLSGGLFISREAALRYAASETDHRPDAVHILPASERLSLAGEWPRL